MKKIAIPGIVAIVAVMLSITSNSYSAARIFCQDTKDSLNNMVMFSIDDPVFENGRMQKINLYTLDSLGWGKGFGVAVNNEKYAITAPQLLLQPNATQTPHLVYPHEKINIRYANTDTLQMYIPGNAVRSHELNFFRKLVQNTGNLYFNAFGDPRPYLKKVNTLNEIQQLEKTIDSVKSYRISFLESYADQFPMSDDFIKTAINCIKSTSIDDSLWVYQLNKDLLKKLNLYTTYGMAKLPSINQLDFQLSPLYLGVCKHIVDIASETDPFDIKDSQSSILARRFDFISTNFTGDTKSFLLANTMNVVHQNKVLISKAILNKFDRECTNEGYRKLINQKLKEDAQVFNVPKGANKLLSLDGKTLQDLSAIISKHKGKLILLDFWASWCGPCRAEMPYNAQLHKKYSGKNIVFLTLSTDRHVSDWKKAAKEEALGNENNFLLLEANQASIMKSYDIKTIPRYVLIGKDGKVLNKDAPRPSDEKLSSVIERNL